MADALGVGARTYDKAKAVVAAAEKEPDKFGDLPAGVAGVGRRP